MPSPWSDSTASTVRAPGIRGGQRSTSSSSSSIRNRVALPTSIGVVSHYNLLERLEPAGPGELYRARDTRAGRTVTVRLLPPEYAPDAASRASVLEKAHGLVGLSHPN